MGEATPLESEQIGRLLGAAHRQLYGVYPGPERWLVAWAHVSHEISRGATCVENNLGNAVISRRWRGGWHLRQVRERDHRGEERWVVQRVRFRSYDTPMDGAVDYWRIITGNFGSSLPYFDTGDAREAGRVLCERGYSTASCEAYGAGLRGLYAELRARYGGPSIKLMRGWEQAPIRAEDWPETRSDLSQVACDNGCFLAPLRGVPACYGGGVHFPSTGMQAILSEETNARLGRGILLVLSVTWLAHGLRVGLVREPTLAGVYALGSLLFLVGAWWSGRPRQDRAPAYLAVVLFFLGAAAVVMVARRSEPPSLWGLVSAPSLMFLWTGRRGALVASLLAFGVLALETAVLPGAASEALPSVLQRATTLGALLAISEIILRALQAQHEHLYGRESALESRAAELEAQLEQVQAAKEEALEGARLKSNFLATMSHELRTPLNAVLGMANLLEGTELSEEQREYTTTIVGGSQALLALIGDILDLSKLEAGKLEIEQVTVDLALIAEQALALVCAQAHGKGVELYFEPHLQAPAAAVTDPSRLQQVLVNLLSNAVKFTDKGEVVLTLEPGADEGEVRFSVRDTGIGIAPETRGKLFQPFSQAAAGQQRGGTGLGLVICQALVGLLGGSIAVESEPGKGSVFSFSIRSAGEARPLSSMGLVTAIPGSVLILDAHERSGHLLRGALQGLARRVEVYTSAAEFFVALGANEKVDAILIDPRVPFEQPTELLQQLATISDELPPVLLLYPRGAPDRKQIEAVFQARFRRAGSALLAKPLMHRHLVPAVLSACLGETTERIHTGRLPRVEERRRLRVLVAEDNPINQRVVARMLAKLGHEVALAENGQLALEAVRKGGVDVVLLDVQMPVMDGLETAHQLVKEFPRKRRPRIIGLTANALAGDRERCLAAGMDDYLTKPLQLPELKQALGEAPHDRERTAAEVIDPHVASQLRFRFDPLQLTLLLEQTSEQLSSGCAALPLAFEARDFSRIEVLAGELKERCAMVGLVRLYAVLLKIEHDARKENVPELTRYVGRLEREGEQARKALLRLASSRSGVLPAVLEGGVTDTPVLAAGRVERSGHRGP